MVIDWFNHIFDFDTLISLESLNIQRDGISLARASFFLSIAVSAISSIGIITALWTAYLTRKSVRSAGEALKISHSVGRAWLAHSDYLSGALTKSNINGQYIENGLVIRVCYKNCGQTPALHVWAQSYYELIPILHTPTKKHLSDKRTTGQMMLAPSEERHFNIYLNDQDSEKLRAGTHDIIIEVVLDYQTVAEELGIRRTSLSYRGSYNPGTVATGGQQTSGSVTAVSGPLGDFAD